MLILWIYLAGITPAFMGAARGLASIMDWDPTEGEEGFYIFANSFWISGLWPIVYFLIGLYFASMSRYNRREFFNKNEELGGMSYEQLRQRIEEQKREIEKLNNQLDEQTQKQIQALKAQYTGKKRFFRRRVSL